MAAPNRAPRTRASGGRSLMLLGVLLALAAGGIVIFIVSQATGAGVQTVQVVVATSDLPSGTVLTLDQTDPTKNYVKISDAFVVKQVSADFKPANAFPYVSNDDLNAKLTDQVIIGPFYAGDILRLADPRLVKIGTAAPGSLANLNPGQLPKGDVLYVLQFTGGGKALAAQGDSIDIIGLDCSITSGPYAGRCAAQTTLQNLYVYSVYTNGYAVVVTHQQAVQLTIMENTFSRLEFVLRKPGDTDPAGTTVVDANSIVSQYFK